MSCVVIPEGEHDGKRDDEEDDGHAVTDGVDDPDLAQMFLQSWMTISVLVDLLLNHVT